MKKYWFSLIGVSLLLLTACGQSSDTPSEETKNGSTNSSTTQVTGAEAIAKQNCTRCHGGNLQGSYGPNLQQIGAKYNKEQLLGVLNNGIGSMGPQKQLNDAQKEELATWLAEKK
ncbi:c-type cytochrome [Risungbinella massiliensis]|uniref:c-type cytochrome n=1 Tax=Risungbinella massiliensis TaxID=1329796 RepID=UPI0005CBB49A|nr:cytochrome c [Risungbinella massiliensis]